jgi:hypothetical protein
VRNETKMNVRGLEQVAGYGAGVLYSAYNLA